MPRDMNQPSSYEKASWLSKATFWWANGMIWKGFKHRPFLEEISLPTSERADVVITDFENQWNLECQKEKPSLIRALWNCFKRDFIIAAIFKFFWGALVSLAAFYFVKALLDFTSGTEEEWKGWVLAVAFFLDCLILSICLQQMVSFLGRVGLRVRGSLLAAVYRKAMKLDVTEINVGDVVNLSTNDCTRMLEAVQTFHYLWSAVAESITIMALLLYLAGVAALPGIAVTFILLGLQYFFGKKVAQLRSNSIDITDNRVGIMTEILLAIKLVKLYAWEEWFSKMVSQIRKEEVKNSKVAALVKSINLMCVFVTPPLIAIAIFGTYVHISTRLNPSLGFTTLSLFNTLRFPLILLPRALRAFGEAMAAVKRLEAFLTIAEAKPLIKQSKVGIRIKNADFGYVKSGVLLNDISLKVRPGQLLGIVGLLGSGKSNLVNAILGQARIMAGNLKVGGKISYLSQTPWIQHATIKQNILFGSEWNEEKYNRVVFACALTRDFEILPGGDSTEIGDRGINLSGGQRARIAMARAVYCDSDIYIFDSPFSALDLHTGIHIFDHCLRDLLKEKMIILVTHHFEFLSQCDVVAILDKGTLPYFGKWNHNAKAVVSRLFPSSSLDQQEENKEHKKSEKPSEKQPEKKSEELAHISFNPPTDSGFGTYKEWAKIAGYGAVFFSLFIFIIAQVTRIMSDWWVSQWTADKLKSSDNFYIWVYSIFVVVFGILLFFRGFYYYFVVLKAATRIHNRMFKKILRAPMIFFQFTSIGVLLNCFSKDQDTADESLPDIIHMTVIYIMILITTIVLVCVVIPLYAIVSGVLLITFLVIFYFYIFGARLLKAAVGETNSNIFSYLSESLTGLSTVRAFQVEDRFVRENLDRINKNHTVIFNLDQLQLWLSFRMELIASLLVLITAFFCVFARGDITPSYLGLAVSNSLQMLVFFSMVVKGLADIDAGIIAIERLTYYSENTPVEAPAHTDVKPPQDWPDQGLVTFTAAQMRYLPGQEPVLKKVNINIHPGEKVGVVGRTGSGKTSLIMALFRLVELDEGEITIDGVKIKEIGLEDLRGNIATIPQEPVLFKGTIRSNLDPFHQHEDKILWDALEHANLKDVVSNMSLQLETEVKENGSNFSLGQKQLFCLARAALKKIKTLGVG
eukprot:TRINITY_DN1013_c0_g1_i2.p1 TRINITY_DN1013_c0_g1~~TRINITY_DN1013_c0_g1_i2.p1  ORF type:complete len:1143 (+),score=404.47 TRINITY_DN1013_c0_g1_i2:123-3551(+)